MGTDQSLKIPLPRQLIHLLTPELEWQRPIFFEEVFLAGRCFPPTPPREPLKRYNRPEGLNTGYWVDPRKGAVG